MNTGSGYPTPKDRASFSDERREIALREVNRSSRSWRLFSDWAKSFIIAVGLFLVIRAFFVEAFKIPSGSMERTLLVGDFLLVNKLVYGAQVPFTSHHLPALRPPTRGDVVVFQFPVDPSKNYVKRLVGLPGDTLAMHNGVLYLNGASQAESYVLRTEPDADPSADDFRWQRNHLIRTAQASAAHPSRNNWGPLVVPDRNLFVLGDNRDNSSDSRYWGFVPDSLLRGQPFIVYYSYAPDSANTFSWLTRIRWSRVGERVR
ncbi:MAG TPA: signal peptidase I [Gemmatimonadaceae bacterium]|nr:signal peptidase I [Gemmatimonadaceae bacterium]